MAFNATAFKAGNPFGGARPSLFQVQLQVPAGVATTPSGKIGSTMASFRVRTSQLPGRTISTSEVPYMGRTVKVNGAPTFEDWETTVYEDEDFSVHEMVVNWMNSINGAKSNTMDFRLAGTTAVAGLTAGLTGIGGYMADLKVTVTSKTGMPIRQVVLHNAWPTVLGAAELDWANNDEILNFPITWAYSHWVASGLGTESVDDTVKGFIDTKVIAPLVSGISGAVFE